MLRDKLTWTLLLLVLLLVGSCAPSPHDPIAIFCSPDSPRMREALNGLKTGLGQDRLEVVCVPEWGDRGEQELRRLRRQRLRLLVVLGTPALLRVAPVEKRTPVVFALVGNPYFTGAAYDPGHPEIHQENVTGIASPPPLEAALQQGASLLGPGSWGLLYDPNDGVCVELAARFTREAPRFGLKALTETSVDAAGDRRGLENLLARGARVIYLPPAPSAARYASLLLTWGREQKVLVVSGYPEGPHQGAVLWVGLDYHRLGEQTAALVKRVLKGEKPARIPIATSEPLCVQADETLLARWSGYPPPRRQSSPDRSPVK